MTHRVELDDPTCVTCGTTEGLNRYGTGVQCLAHSPAGILGRTVPVPDPARTLAGLSVRPVTGFSPVPYGNAQTDPLHRTLNVDVAGKRFGDRLPRHPCPKCGPNTRNPLNHKGDHA